MPFQPGHKYGGSKPGTSRRAKEKVIEAFFKKFEEGGTTEQINKLYESDFKEYMRIFTALLPRDQQIDMNVNIFEGRTPEELEHFADTGEWPEEAKG